MSPPHAHCFALDVAPLRRQPTGVGVYVRELAAALRELDDGSVSLLGARDGNFEGTAWRGVPAVRFRSRHYQIWLHRHADREARRLGARLVHYTNSAAPLTARLPYVVTVHDLSLLRVPRSHPPLRVATAPVTVVAALRARAIVVPSDATRREVRRVVPAAARRIVVVPHGASHVGPGQATDDAILARSGLQHGRYILSVGTLEHRKNQQRLVEAFGHLARTRPWLRLVLAGAPGWGAAAVLCAVERSPVREQILITGYVDDRELAALRAGAAAVAYVSLYEGFGLPVLEAVAAGVPVVTSASSAMPETALGRATLVDPHRVESIARGLETSLRDAVRAPVPALRSWQDVARETRAVYEHALRSGPASWRRPSAAPR